MGFGIVGLSWVWFGYMNLWGAVRRGEAWSSMVWYGWDKWVYVVRIGRVKFGRVR